MHFVQKICTFVLQKKNDKIGDIDYKSLHNVLNISVIKSLHDQSTYINNDHSCITKIMSQRPYIIKLSLSQLFKEKTNQNKRYKTGRNN